MGETGQVEDLGLVFKKNNYINYSTSDFKSAVMEIYLGSRCEFVITTGTGWDSIPTRVFRKSAIYIDYVQISSIPSWCEDSIYIFKKIKLRDKNKLLNLEEIFYLIEDNFDTNNPIFYQLEDRIELINNSSIEILGAVKDYLDKKEKTNIQNIYWTLFADCIEKYNLKQYHFNEMKLNNGHINIASSFIEANNYLLDTVISDDVIKIKPH
jgi:putative glycosyltransferase (TIGR04372 family)